MRSKAAAQVQERGLVRGELQPTLDVGLAIELLFGPVWYRLLLRHAPLDEAFADAIVASFLAAHAKSGRRC